MTPVQEVKAPNRRLDSWKEIAAFFGRDERTVKRWEKDRALPIHRLPGGSRARVFAFTQELERWMHSVEVQPADEIPGTDASAGAVPQADSETSDEAELLASREPSEPPRRRVFTKSWVIAAAVALLAVVAFGGLLMFHPRPSAQAANPGHTASP